MTTIGERIRRLREGRHMTQQALGDVVGVGPRTVGNWERGETHPMNKIGALEDFFGVSLTDGTQIADDIVNAIERSDLTRAEKAELVAHYWRLRETHERGAAG